MKIGKGKNPSVAVNNEGVVLEVHENDSDIRLCYKVGELRENHIEWGEVQKYDVGITPCVCIQNWSIQIVEVHQDTTTETLEYCNGAVDLKGRLINWKTDKQNLINGKCPRIAISESGVLWAHYLNFISGLDFHQSFISFHLIIFS